MNLSIRILDLLYSHLGLKGLLEPIPAVKGREAGSILNRSSTYTVMQSAKKKSNLLT